jgi:hypothetical protein
VILNIEFYSFGRMKYFQNFSIHITFRDDYEYTDQRDSGGLAIHELNFFFISNLDEMILSKVCENSFRKIGLIK